MVVCNVDRYLAEAIESILDQTFRDFEFIIVDFGSTDRSKEIVASYVAKDSRVKFREISHCGLTEARNAACVLAQGKYIAVMDADDVSLPERLMWQVEFMEKHPEVGVVGGDVDLIDAFGKSLTSTVRSFGVSLERPIEDRDLQSELLIRCPFWEAVLMRRDAFIQVGGYRTILPQAEDYDLWMRFSEHFELANLKSVVFKYRIHPHQVSVRRRAQQTLCALAARASAEARRNGKPDPLDAVSEITPKLLAEWGISEAKQRAAVAVDCQGWIGLMCAVGEWSSALDATIELLKSSDWKDYRYLMSIVALVRTLMIEPELPEPGFGNDASAGKFLGCEVGEANIRGADLQTREMWELLFRARRDRAGMARRLHVAVAKRDELESERDRAPLRHRIADLLNGYLHRIPLFPSLAKAALLRLVGIWPSRRRKTAALSNGATRAATASVALGFGINMAGYLNSEKGVGEGGRATLRSIRAAQIPCQLINAHEVSSSNVETVDAKPSEENPYDFNLVHLNGDAVPYFTKCTRSPFWDRFNIGYWAWELPALPPVWCESFRYFDEIWVPSTFCLDAVSRVSPIPVVRVPHSIQTDVVYEPDCTRSRFGVSPDTFVFLFFFDFHSFIARKNPIGLIEAFRRAFAPGDDALLFIKCARSDWDPPAMARLVDASQGANVQLYDAVISRPALNSLMSICDAYVSLHRSEGFGLTLTEAMNMSKPVIATGYSGNMDFMTLSNSFPVKYRIVEIEEDHGPYTRGCAWAEPDLDHAAELMRYVYIHRDKACEVGARARQDIRSQLHPQTVGRMVRERLLKAEEEAERRRRRE